MTLPINICDRTGYYLGEWVLCFVHEYLPKIVWKFFKVTAKFAMPTIKVIETGFSNAFKSPYLVILHKKQHFPLRYVIDMDLDCTIVKFEKLR